MRISDIRTLYDYNYWANRRILDTAANVPERYASATLGSCNLKEALVHTMVAESIWLRRWQGVNPESVSFPEDFTSLDDLRAWWRDEERRAYAFLDTLGDADLDRPLTYAHSDGSETRILWHTLIHVVNHGTQHRGETALLLTELGHSPGALDFTAFLREMARG